MRKLPLTRLRADLYNIVDTILKTGVPIIIERNNQQLKIVPMKKISKLDNLVAHPDTIVGNPEDIVHMDWLSEWNEGKDL